MELRTTRQLALIVFCHTLVRSSMATVSFPKIQPIVGFSDSCTIAYSTPVGYCKLDDFPAIGGTDSCSQACQQALVAAQTFVQRACQGQQAAQNSLIGQLFTGDVVNYLCTTTDGDAATTSASSTESTAALSSTMVTASSQHDHREQKHHVRDDLVLNSHISRFGLVNNPIHLDFDFVFLLLFIPVLHFLCISLEHVYRSVFDGNI
ncbi:hypothetical protein A1O1_02615 [Capronia coronata CBS 617.96]|uniref:Extracellular membrane protein CFEM domain-containing protein n=1 Tax=Capronia coronata CBS 617.96 TaxID=1182541 RepID=W9YMR8_9EURO|nr:uncharacterized protein A1O1_02615 [Capronia coronata CBS 617.96]EXJ94222.1 hypothetical protein A1O1_02615 [Capronia coronata CBS 617.96]